MLIIRVAPYHFIQPRNGREARSRRTSSGSRSVSSSQTRLPSPSRSKPANRTRATRPGNDPATSHRRTGDRRVRPAFDGRALPGGAARAAAAPQPSRALLVARSFVAGDDGCLRVDPGGSRRQVQLSFMGSWGGRIGEGLAVPATQPVKGGGCAKREIQVRTAASPRSLAARRQNFTQGSTTASSILRSSRAPGRRSAATTAHSGQADHCSSSSEQSTRISSISSRRLAIVFSFVLGGRLDRAATPRRSSRLPAANPRGFPGCRCGWCLTSRGP